MAALGERIHPRYYVLPRCWPGAASPASWRPIRINAPWPAGEGWLVLSDLAEHLGLRSREMLLAAFDAAGLQVVGRLDARPEHPRAADASDPLHAARAAEVTSLWRLAAR